MIYPVFLPHAGCPFQCIYCNQRAVVSSGDSGSDIIGVVESTLKDYCNQVRKSGRSGEIAFFGGTFTALPVRLIESILASASFAVKQGVFTGIRFSTRPDCFRDEVMDLLVKNPIRTVELGVQSLSDDVLQKSRRAYSVSSVLDAARLVKNQGWKLGIQLMAGLPGDDMQIFIESMNKAIGMEPDFLRLYPTLVLEGTPLADSYRQGVYTALSLDRAIEWLTPAYDLTIRAGIPVIRMGLHSDPALEKPGVVIAGPYHPAFGCLVKSRWWRDRLDRDFVSSPELRGGEIFLHVAPNQVGDAIGHRRSNIGHWKNRWNISVRIVADAGLSGIEMVRL